MRALFGGLIGLCLTTSTPSASFYFPPSTSPPGNESVSEEPPATFAPNVSLVVRTPLPFGQVTPAQMVPVYRLDVDPGIPSEWKPSEIARIKALSGADYAVVQREVNTPREAAIYCTRVLTHGDLDKDPDRPTIDIERFGCDFWMSGLDTHLMNVVDCDDAAVLAPSLLRDNGFHPYILCMRGSAPERVGSAGRFPVYEMKPFGHAMFIYKTKEGLLGTLGINEWDIVRPCTSSIDELLNEWSAKTKNKITSWTIYDLAQFFPDYDTNRRNNNPLTLSPF